MQNLDQRMTQLVAGGLPDRAGQPTQIQLITTPGQLLDPSGTGGTGTASGTGGYAGPGPLATPGDMCDAQIIPVVTGYVDHDLLGQLAAALCQAGSAGPASHGLPGGPASPPGDGGDPGDPARTGHPGRDLPGQHANPPGDAGGDPGAPAGTGHSDHEPGQPSAAGQADTGLAGTGQADTGLAGTRLGGTGLGRTGLGGTGLGGTGPADALAAAYARELVLRGAMALLSGPAGLISRLRTTGLTGPAASISLPLDIGTATDTIPPHLRRAVILRDQRCSFPGCRQRPAACQVHHIIPVSEGGPTKLDHLILVCRFHHLIAIHEWGWRLILNADGTKTAISPDRRRILHTHSTPTAALAYVLTSPCLAVLGLKRKLRAPGNRGVPGRVVAGHRHRA